LKSLSHTCIERSGFSRGVIADDGCTVIEGAIRTRWPTLWEFKKWSTARTCHYAAWVLRRHLHPSLSNANRLQAVTLDRGVLHRHRVGV